MTSESPNDRPSDCPMCGTPFPLTKDRCWLCGWTLGEPIDRQPLKAAESIWTFNVGTMLLFVALLGMLLTAARFEIWMAIALAIFSLPSAIYTAAIAQRRRRATGRHLSVLEKIELFIKSAFLLFAATLVFTLAGVASVEIVAMVAAWFDPSVKVGQILPNPLVVAGLGLTLFLAHFAIRRRRAARTAANGVANRPARKK